MPDARDAYDELKSRLLQRLASDIDHSINLGNKAASRTLIQKRLDALLVEDNILLKQHERRQLAEDIVGELLNLAPSTRSKDAAAPFFTIQELCDSRMVNKESIDFLQAAVAARLNIVISGLAETGKTTLLRALCDFVPEDERIVTIEETAELQLNHEHVISLETRQSRGSGHSDISTETLIMTSSRSRLDRLIIGSIAGREAFTWLQVVNGTLACSMTSCEAESAQDSLSRIEMMALLGEPAAAQEQVREQIMSAVDLIVHLERMPDNSLKVGSISEPTGFKDSHFVTAKIFQFEQSGLEDGQIIGTLQPAGAPSHCAQKIRDAGIPLPTSTGI